MFTAENSKATTMLATATGPPRAPNHSMGQTPKEEGVAASFRDRPRTASAMQAMVRVGCAGPDVP